VIDAGLRQARADGSLVLIESTSSQVNQFGGYTGQTPEQFAATVHAAGRRHSLSEGKLLLGGDHLGPYPWRDQPSAAALRNAGDLVRACVLAGYGKIHLDASMACADDDGPALSDHVIAQRAAVLCRAAETAYEELPPGSPPLVYVIGTEVPTPGGETHPGEALQVTTVEHLHRTLQVFRTAFERNGVERAWERVIGIVVQPGVEFGENIILDYDRSKAQPLSAALPEYPCLVYEAHSTDYQSPTALRHMVEDHFGILKVGPALTFGFREAIFALSAIEYECCAGKRGFRLSRVREALEQAMLRNPSYWASHYHGTEEEQRFARAFSYSDRCRYYWTDPMVREEVDRLYGNLSGFSLPPTAISQYLPLEYEAIRAGKLSADPNAIIEHHVRAILRVYAAACGMLSV
jgi:D-tagatose-1,6-bisphosphate aldolase subunit GatZ/KbaZ